eukprot:108775_1
MADEGWKNPLDWVHLDDHILKQNIGFRPGHIQIFNRKFDLWVKRYNDVRRTIDPKRKGKHGVLIVGKGETTTLKSNYLYVFTKVIVREGGTLTVKPWSPTQPDGGVLFINCHQDIVLERDSKISVDGKGYWGSAKPDRKGFGPGGGGSVGYACNGAGGASYAGLGYRGYNIAEDEDVFANKTMDGRKIEIEKMNEKDRLKDWNEKIKQEYNEYDRTWDILDENPPKTDKTDDKDDPQRDPQAENDDVPQAEKDYDLWKGDAGVEYWKIGDKVWDPQRLNERGAIKSLKCLAINKHNLRKSFPDGELATPDAADTHRHALGSGGGCNIEIYHGKHGWKFRAKRGGAGGGAVRLWCDRLIMYEKSRVTAEGSFDPFGDPFSAGGSGGSIFITVTSEIVAKNRDSDDKNIGLFALGGGRSQMDRMYLENTWSEKEIQAKDLIRKFEKLRYPRLKMREKLQKMKENEERKQKRKKADYIDSDDDDDEDDDFWSDDSEESHRDVHEENKDEEAHPGVQSEPTGLQENPLKLTFGVDRFCDYMVKKNEEDADKILKQIIEMVELYQKRLLQIDGTDNITRGGKEWVIEDAHKQKTKKQKYKEIKHAFERLYGNITDVDPEEMEEMDVQRMLALLQFFAQHYLEEEQAALEKEGLKSLPIAVQIAMLKSEFKHQAEDPKADSAVAQSIMKVKEEDLWLWKWKKMPKMPVSGEPTDENPKIDNVFDGDDVDDFDDNVKKVVKA